MLKKEARRITGGLSAPSKMPGPAYNLPAVNCLTGSKLVQIAGSVCAGCYALKGRYHFPNVKAALARRLASLGHPDWIAAMTVLIKGEPVFRWHDSGDLQSVEHLKAIFEVCKNTAETRHWLPTREAKFLRLMDPEVIPKNLLIRFSSHMVNQGPVTWWPWTSTVVAPRPFWKLGLWFNKLFRIKGKCFASIQGNKCLSCRACWSREVKHVTYPKH